MHALLARGGNLVLCVCKGVSCSARSLLHCTRLWLLGVTTVEQVSSAPTQLVWLGLLPHNAKTGHSFWFCKPSSDTPFGKNLLLSLLWMRPLEGAHFQHAIGSRSNAKRFLGSSSNISSMISKSSGMKNCLSILPKIPSSVKSHVTRKPQASKSNQQASK